MADHSSVHLRNRLSVCSQRHSPGAEVALLAAFPQARGTAVWLPGGPPMVCGARSVFPFAACLSVVGRAVWLLVLVFLSLCLGRRSACFIPGSWTEWMAQPGLCFQGVGRPGCTWAHPHFVGRREAVVSVLLGLPVVLYDLLSAPCAQHARRHKASVPARGRAV